MSLEGVKGHDNIVSVWKKHYEKLFNGYSNDSKICKIDVVLLKVFCLIYVIKVCQKNN